MNQEELTCRLRKEIKNTDTLFVIKAFSKAKDLKVDRISSNSIWLDNSKFFWKIKWIPVDRPESNPLIFPIVTSEVSFLQLLSSRTCKHGDRPWQIDTVDQLVYKRLHCGCKVSLAMQPSAMTDLCKRFGLDVDSAINQLLDYKNSPAKQVGLFANK